MKSKLFYTTFLFLVFNSILIFGQTDNFDLSLTVSNTTEFTTTTPPSPPPDEGGPSGSGGSKTIREPREVCKENWVCSEWTKCTNNTQTINCYDANLCDTYENRPPFERECGSKPRVEQPLSPILEEKETKINNIIGIVFVLTIIFFLWKKFKKSK